MREFCAAWLLIGLCAWAWMMLTDYRKIDFDCDLDRVAYVGMGLCWMLALWPMEMVQMIRRK